MLKYNPITLGHFLTCCKGTDTLYGIFNIVKRKNHLGENFLASNTTFLWWKCNIFCMQLYFILTTVFQMIKKNKLNIAHCILSVITFDVFSVFIAHTSVVIYDWIFKAFSSRTTVNNITELFTCFTVLAQMSCVTVTSVCSVTI